MGLGYSIASADICDIEGIFAIENECFSTPWSMESIKSTILNQDNLVLLAKNVDNTIIGYMSMECILDEGYIGNVAVSKSHRRRGIARRLIENTVSQAVKKDMKFITLEVRRSNAPAILLYGSMGFLQVGKRRDFYSNPKEDALLLTKYLK